jgi:hypothetical protein
MPCAYLHKSRIAKTTMATGKRSFFKIIKKQSAEFGQVAVLAAVFFHFTFAKIPWSGSRLC